MNEMEILFSEKDINKRVNELAKMIYHKYGNDKVVFICTLKGAVFFTCDLLKKYKGDARIEFLKASSYHGTESSGEIKLNLSINEDTIRDEHIIIVEDIIDTGYTLSFLKDYINKMHPKSLEICTLLDKECKRKTAISADYVGFKVDDLFVIGYGLDYDQKYRNLPYIGVLK